ncbi:MAG TPA: SEC-C domain-containing protein [Sporolactobacillaceae bacterium]|nr:SEC-C domain-containing protein [Sporolactobacillaceae bacterium]
MTTESVTKRNDPCPCGSGKKFKKCCMTKPDNGIAHLLTQEFERVNQGLYSFSRKNFRGKLDRYINTLCLDHAIPYTQRAVVKDYSYIWSLFHLPVQETATTFDLYLERYQREATREAAVQMLTEWKNTHFSIYRIRAITEDNKMVLNDLWLDQTYTVPVLTGHQPPTLDNLVMGMIVPIYENTHDFLLGYAQIEGRLFTEEKLQLIRETYLNDPKLPLEDQLDQALPLIFIDLLSGDQAQVMGQQTEEPTSVVKKEAKAVREEKADNLETSMTAAPSNHVNTTFNGNESQQKAFDLFLDQKEAESVTQAVLDETTQLWSAFVDAHDPTIKKPEAYAAALDYWASNRAAQGQVTQAGISKKYGVSTATVSKNFRLLDEFFTQAFSIGQPSDERELAAVHS